MRFRVIRQQMPSVCDRPGNLRPRSDEASDQEEGRFYFVSRKNFQQPFGVNIVRTIVISKRQMVRIGEMSNCASVKL